MVTRYELQILFRMEILQSEAGASIQEPMKQKFVKQISLLLEAIQCHLEGGFFGDWSIDNYVRKIIKSRYVNLHEIKKNIFFWNYYACTLKKWFHRLQSIEPDS